MTTENDWKGPYLIAGFVLSGRGEDADWIEDADCIDVVDANGCRVERFCKTEYQEAKEYARSLNGQRPGLPPVFERPSAPVDAWRPMWGDGGPHESHLDDADGWALECAFGPSW